MSVQSITKIATPFFAITVWRTEDGLLAALDADALDTNADLRRAVRGAMTKAQAFRVLVDCGRVVAVEIVDRGTGEGARLDPP